MNELSIFQGDDLPESKVDESKISKVVKSTEYLPRLQLMTSGSKECKAGNFPINHYAIIDGKNFIDCGKQVDVAVLDIRLKALDLSGDSPISIFDPAYDENDEPTGEFKRIQLQSDVKDSGCMFGPEYLLYVPEQKKYVTFFMGTKSSRIESPSMTAKKHQAATLTSQNIETKSYSWYAPKVESCQTELVLPEKDEVIKEITKFQNEKSTDLSEMVDEEEAKTQERAR